MGCAQLVDALNTSIEMHAFSGVVSIRQKGGVLYERAAGYADRSNKVENTVEPASASLQGTKFFTALAIGKLIAARKLTFDTKLKLSRARFPALFAQR
jgi:CubicO group peptidase (beta-lactamase class C family)